MEKQPLCWLPAGARPEKRSYYAGQNCEWIYASISGKDAILAHGDGAPYRELAGEKLAPGVKACPLSHENRLVLNAYLPHTAPTAFGREFATFGLGDRLGLCASAHLRAIRESVLKPVLAQQSLRELNFLHRSYDDMIDAAAFGAFREGYTGGYAADGDHLKTPEQIQTALASGCTMITLDASEVLSDLPENAPVHEKYLAIPPDRRAELEAIYLENAAAGVVGLQIERAALERLAVQYGACVLLAERVYAETILPQNRPVDLEISLDETASVTAHAAHFFVANELTRRNIPYTSVAPRFVGEFHKAVDYVGSLPDLYADLQAHAKIAAHFGHKLSVHSGSDKFSVYAEVNRATNGFFHLKTSGTSWLCAVDVLARCEPALYRRMHARALESFGEAKKAYVVHADPARIPPLDSVSDAQLPDYLKRDDSRQMLHITYGFLFDDSALSGDIRTALAARRAELDETVYRHIRAHIEALGCLKPGETV